MKKMILLTKWIGLTLLVVFGAIIVIGVGGVRLPFTRYEVTQQKPYIDFIGREYRVKAELETVAWNDFPDKENILVVTLQTSPIAGNRFVSYKKPLKPGHKFRIIKAWKQFEVVEFTSNYEVLFQDLELPEGVPVLMSVKSDGIPDPRFFERTTQL